MKKADYGGSLLVFAKACIVQQTKKNLNSCYV